MNTAKQVNAIIGLLLLSFLTFGAYYVNEGARAAAARESQAETMAHRGATLFVNNCRGCHGLEGDGPDGGGIGPRLNNVAFLVLDEGNPFKLPKTPDGDARSIHDFLFNTITCGRTNTAMPPWSEKHGGPLSDIQIEYIASMAMQGRWDLVTEIGHEHDALAKNAEAASFALLKKAYTAPADPKDALTKAEKQRVDSEIAYGRAKKYADLSAADQKTVLENFKRATFVDPAGVAITGKNCGQYGAAAQDFRDRNPLSGAPAGGAGDGAAPTTAGAPAAGGNLVKLGQAVAGKYGCVACHSATGTAGIGPTWKGLAGSEVEFVSGPKVAADDAYLKESIESPNAKVRKGFAPGIMPQDFGKQFKAGELDQVIAYIKSLK